MQPPPSQRNATYQATNLQVEERILERWDKKIHGDRLKTKHSGCYYMFESLDGSISVEGGDDMTGSSSDIEADTPCIVLSIAKAITGTAVMRTMHLRPADWYPEKAMHRFKGWEAWRDFDVHDDAGSGCGRRSEVITIHQLLTHTSGFPFGLQGSRSQIRDTALYYMPGTGCGYSIGHRILGWMLLDYWRDEARAKRVSGVDEFRDQQAVYTYLLYDPLGMASTRLLRGLRDTPRSLLGKFLDMQDFDKATDTDETTRPTRECRQHRGAYPMKLAPWCSGEVSSRTTRLTSRAGRTVSVRTNCPRANSQRPWLLGGWREGFAAQT